MVNLGLAKILTHSKFCGNCKNFFLKKENFKYL